jgi:hypothetical protein
MARFRRGSGDVGDRSDGREIRHPEGGGPVEQERARAKAMPGLTVASGVALSGRWH